MGKGELDQSKSWAEADYLALPATTMRIELFDGRLQVSPPPNNAHDQMAGYLWATLDVPARTAGLRALLTPALRLAPNRITVPDVAVGRFGWSSKLNQAADTVLVVEVTSPGNAHVDHGRKKAWYAEAGIAWYLLVEPNFVDYEALTLRLHRLDGEGYAEYAVAKPGETLPLDGLLPAALRPDDLIRP